MSKKFYCPDCDTHDEFECPHWDYENEEDFYDTLLEPEYSCDRREAAEDAAGESL